jgi:hypothetical protein
MRFLRISSLKTYNGERGKGEREIEEGRGKGERER